MGTLLEKANSILTEKTNKITAENIKEGVTVFDVTGTKKNLPPYIILKLVDVCYVDSSATILRSTNDLQVSMNCNYDIFIFAYNSTEYEFNPSYMQSQFSNFISDRTLLADVPNELVSSAWFNPIRNYLDYYNCFGIVGCPSNYTETGQYRITSTPTNEWTDIDQGYPVYLKRRSDNSKIYFPEIIVNVKSENPDQGPMIEEPFEEEPFE